jgi:hypothetical protein
MKRTSILLFFLSFVVSGTYAQSSKTEDVLYLKNQWVIRGKILEQNNNSIKIQTHEGNIFVFPAGDVEKISQEKIWRNFVYKSRGFANFTELGPLIAGKTTIDGVTTAAFSFQTVNGYKFSQYATAGIGVGADLYATQTVLPVFASFRGDLSKAGSVIPFYFADGGYGINITQNSDNGTAFKGGPMYAAGLGVKIPFNRSAGFLLSFGYRYQKTSYSYNNISTDVTYNRLAVRAGFFL